MIRLKSPASLLLLGALFNQGAAAALGQDQAKPAQVQPGSAARQPPAGATASRSLNARSLGITEAVVEYCSKADPSAEAKYQARVKRLVQGASKEALAKLRRSTEYRQAHDSEAEFIGKVDQHNVSRACSESPAKRR
jgi:hypothetical protein